MTTSISASLIQALRQDTGAKMMDCKHALQETQGDLEQAKDWLRKKGMASGAKKTERPASEGVVAVMARGGHGALLEVNCETDFVARTGDFQNLVREVLDAAFDQALHDIDALMGLNLTGGTTAKDKSLEIAGKLGENIVMRRLTRLAVNPGVVAAYTHSPLASAMGKIGVLVALESTADADALQDIGKKIAMHIAASAPAYISTDDVPEEDVAKERSFLVDQIQEKEPGRPEDVVAKMVEGRLRKFLEDKVLLEQKFVCDGTKTVRQYVEEESKRLGAPIAVAAFERIVLGV